MKVLFTSPIIEHPAAGGPQLRIENSIKALNEICELHVISRASRRSLGGIKAEKFYKRHCVNFIYVPRVKFFFENKVLRDMEFEFNKKFLDKDEDFIINYIKQNKIDIIWFGYGNISYELMKNIKKKVPQIKMICDTDSVWSRFVLRGIPYEKDIHKKNLIEKEGRKKEQEEKEWVEFCDVTTAVSKVDAEYYKELTEDKNKIKLFSNVIDLRNYEDAGERPMNFQNPCIYLAGTFEPNSPMDKAARWVLDNVWDKLKEIIPDIRFYIIGNGSKNTLSDINDEAISIVGKVDSVLPYLKNADVALVPLFFESGTRFKILEAAACKIPIVSTTLGAEGIPVESGQNILIADEADDFVENIVKLIKDKEFARIIAENCNRLVENKYGIQNLIEEGNLILRYIEKKE